MKAAPLEARAINDRVSAARKGELRLALKKAEASVESLKGLVAAAVGIQVFTVIGAVYALVKVGALCPMISTYGPNKRG